VAREPRKSNQIGKRRELDLSSEIIPSEEPIDTKEEDLSEEDAILDQLEKRLNTAWIFWQPTFEASKEDINFIYRDQWPSYAQEGRENRPMLTMNMLPQYSQQVVNAARRARFGIQVRQLSGKNDVIYDNRASSKSYSRSQVMEGLIRDIEYRSKAHDKYCRACQHQVEGGFSWLFVTTKENFHDPFDIELCIEHEKHRYSVLIDSMSMEEDHSDAMWIARSVDMTKDEYEERWPDMPIGDWNATKVGRRVQNEGSYWRGDNENVRVTDYWWKEPMEREAVEFVLETETVAERLVMYEDEHGAIFDELEDAGYVRRQSKKVKGYKVKYARCSYRHILEGPHDWPSMHLPGVMVRGREVNLEDMDMLIGLFRYAHDPQRMVNFWTSSATEKMALVPRQPFIAAAEQIANYQEQWENMYTSNRPVLLYDHIEGESAPPPPQRQSTVAMAQGELQMVAQSRAFLQDTVGLHDASIGVRTNEVSGRALENRQERGELGTYDFLDNTAKAITRVGEILTDMIPRVYTTDYARRIVLEDDTEVFIDLNKVVVDKDTGKEIKVFSLDHARYSCRVDVGPASRTQREEFVRMMIEWGRSDPEGFASFRDLVVENMDFPKARVIAKRMKALVPYHLLSPEEQEERGGPPPPTPAEQIQQMQAQADQAKAQAEMVKAQADVEKAKLGVEEARLRAMQDGVRLGTEQARAVRQQSEEAAKAGGEGEEQPLTQAEVKRMIAQEVANRS